MRGIDVPVGGEAAILGAIAAAEEIREPLKERAERTTNEAGGMERRLDRPDLIVDHSDLPASVHALRDHLASSENLFDRGMPVRLARDGQSGLPTVQELNFAGVVMEAHRLCRPIQRNAKGEMVPVTLPNRMADLYLSMRGKWRLPVLNGIATAPLLAGDGEIFDHDGFDPGTGMWCARVPVLQVPNSPSWVEAKLALRLLRQVFRTFPFADSALLLNPVSGVLMVDTGSPPGLDETAMLAGLLTAVVRASIPLAPGLLVKAAPVSGAGTGKGLIVRAVCAIAHGIAPRAFTPGSERAEFEKRLAAELVEAAPALFLDNVNGVALRSDMLASVMTERPTRVRLLGRTQMVELNSNAFVAITGNGLSVSEDLARRFLSCELDAQTENPEDRPFAPGFLEDIKARRPELLAAALTIWRWGRQNPTRLDRGQPLGSFEIWADWVRDPLLSLGCADPVLKIAEAKANDPTRLRVIELFNCWWECHGDRPTAASDLDERVRAIADPQGRGRQWLASYLGRLDGTRLAGFILTAEKAGGRWSARTYALSRSCTPEAVTDSNGDEF